MRRYKGKPALLVAIVAILFALWDVLYWSYTVQYLGIWLYHVQNNAITLVALLILGFMLLPATRNSPQNKLPWYDALLLCASLVAPIYLFFMYQPEIERFNANDLTIFETVISWITLLCVIELTRRAVGPAMPILAALFLLHPYFSNYLPGIFSGRGYGLNEILGMVFFSSSGLFGLTLGIAGQYILPFMIFSSFLLVSGAGNFITDLAFGITGHIRGGPAKVAIIGSAMMGTVSGSATSNVVATGSITIPLMKKIGYQPAFAGAIEAAASTGGIITPPVMGIVAFIMAQWLGISYWAVCVAAFLPAVLYYIALFIQVDLEAVRLGLKGVPRAELPSVRQTLKRGWIYLLPVVMLMVLIGGFGKEAWTAAIWSIGLIVVTSWFNKKELRMSPKQILKGLEQGAVGSLTAGITTAICGIYIGSMVITGVGLKLSGGMIDIAGGNLFILLVLAAVANLVIGMGAGQLPAYIMTVALTGPALLKLGVIPLAAHMFAFYYAIIGFITPPVAIAAYVAAGIAQSSPMKTGWIASRLAICTFVVPFAFVFNNGILLQGSIETIVIGSIIAIVAAMFLAFAVSGRMYVVGGISWPERALVFAGAVFLMLSGWINIIIGFGIIILVLLFRFFVIGTARKVPK